MLDLIKKEMMEAAIRIGCAQAVRGVRGTLSSVFTSEKARSFLNSKVGSGILTTAVGFGLGRASSHGTAQSIAHECRVQGLARTGNGLVEKFTSSEETEEK